MRTNRSALLGAVLAAGVGLAGCDIRAGEGGGFSFGVFTGKAEDTWTRTYALSAGGRLEIVNTNGRIDAEPSDGSSVEVAARRTVRAATDEGARELLGRVEMREEVSDARVRVEVRPPRMSGLSGQEVKWTLKVPKGVQVDLRTVNGRIHLTGLDGSVHAETTNGGVTGERMGSNVVEASAVNGGVSIELTAPLRADGRVEIETVNGGASLDLPSDSKATLSGRTVNGSVSVSGLDVQHQGDDTRRRMDGTLNGGGARVSVSTTNGSVKFGRAGAPTTS